jgi:LmbE family N-acetylglucosaminyl deacetylase
MDSRATSLDGIATLGRILTVWAHPDDECYLAGATMAMARSMRHDVTCIVATPGDHAATEDARARTAEIRTAELARALRILGVDDMALLGARDGECDRFDDDLAIAMISDAILDRKPDTVITFGPDGFTGHPDHRAVSRWVTAAVAKANPTVRVLHSAATPSMAGEGRDIDERLGVFAAGLPTVYEPDELALCVAVEGHWLDAKLRALQAHDSQTAPVIAALGEARYRRWISAEVFVDAARNTLRATTRR